ncbi:restriction endonuclease subunit S [Acinetobacter sp. GG2]|uniref:restriction endonuclease subunit S n=1 Tax=Acinetobacter sp. GG2 TaxID=651305 RepID=UPI0002DB821D|nr:restriction endonuclease subunit S [Acinetobacter sp. GG2]
MSKYQKYAEYKDSEIVWMGNVPSHWTSERFKWLLTEKLKTSNCDLPAGSISFGEVVYKNEDNLSPDTKASYQEVLKDEFLINPLNLNYDLKSLRTALSKINVVVSTGYIVLHCNKSLDKKYVRWLLHEFDVSHMKTLGAGVRQTVNFSDIANSYFYLPTNIEQKQIAHFLDHETAKIDSLIAKQEKLIELLKEKRQAVISYAVTKGLDPNVAMKDSGVEWLGEVPEHWRVCRLKHVGYIQSGIAKGKDLKDKISISVPMLRVANVQDGYLNLDEVHQIDIEPEQLERYLLQNGDVLMNEGGDNDKLGRGAVWRNEIKNCIHQNHVFAIRTTLIEPEWLDILTRASYAKFHFFRQSKQSTNLASISATNIKETPILVPPKNEREQILSYLNKQFDRFSKLENRCYQQIELLKERRTALISSAVTGKIDVRHWQNSNKNNRKLSA